MFILRQKYRWSKVLKSPGFVLSNNNNSVEISQNQLKDGTFFETVFIDKELSKGKFYWEITINEIAYLDNFLVGVAKKNIALTKNPLDSNSF